MVQLTDNTGVAQRSYDYDTFGNELSHNENDDNPLRYNGQYWDDETQTYYLRARQYNPVTGRFTTEDTHWTVGNMIYDENGSISLEAILQAGNLYAYCMGNPVMFVDPSGNIITEQEQKMFEEGKMAPMSYSHLMNLTYHWYLADTEEQKAIYYQWAEDFRATGYTTTNGEFPYVDKGILFMPSLISGEPTKEQHYFRNKLNLNFTWEQYTTLQERLPESMKWNDKVAATYHQNNKVNGQPNRKYVSFDGHFELVYNDDNVLLTQYNNPQDMGTYNYVHPNNFIGHGIKDVKPYGIIWIKWGNVPEHAGALYK